MLNSKMLTANLKYKLKSKSNFEQCSNELKEEIVRHFKSQEFVELLKLINEECLITVEVNNSEIEFIISLFTTAEQQPVSSTKLLKQYIDKNMTSLHIASTVAKLVRARVY